MAYTYLTYKKKPWTQEERYILKRQYGLIPFEELLKLLPGRTEQSVYAQVYYLRKRGWTFNKDYK